MLIDTFSYFNEKELLELRIRMLYDHVDKFIICEGDHTHSGNYKGFQLQEVLDEIGVPQYKVQIVHVMMPSYEKQSNAWVRERMQRDAAAAYIQDSDICIASDLDEIPDPSKLELHTYMIGQAENTVIYLSMHNLQQRADLEVLIKGKHAYWEAAYICTGRALREYTLSQLREKLTLQRIIPGFEYKYAYERNVPHVAGWHFSWMGDNSNKLKNFLHWDEFSQLYKKGDILGRSFHTLHKFNTEKLPKLIYELPHIKEFLLK